MVGSDAMGLSGQRRGTPGFRAPELLRTSYEKGIEKPGEFSVKSDIWAIGCILYQIATTGTARAFPDDYEVVKFYESQAQSPQIELSQNPSLNLQMFCPEKNDKVSFLSQINKVIASCLAQEPSGRATAMQLKVRFETMKKNLGNELTDDESGG